MHKISRGLCFFLFMALMGACVEPDYFEGRFPDVVVNLHDANTQFDDYNASAPGESNRGFPIYFSSNRNSQGENFDIVRMEISYDFVDEIFLIAAYDSNNEYFRDMLDTTNTDFNEYGPSIVKLSSDYYNNYQYFFYCNESNGNYEIKFTNNETKDGIWSEPIVLSHASSEYDEGYPAFSHHDSCMYYQSNASGDFNIYKVSYGDPDYFNMWCYSEVANESLPVDLFNSIGEDKCPYINGNLFLFASDRAGGYGGFDLYYSEFIDGAWTVPTNFGSEINSPYDEFRPIAVHDRIYTNDLLIFSSNRPGGKGGYDLYFTGIPTMIVETD